MATPRVRRRVVSRRGVPERRAQRPWVAELAVEELLRPRHVALLEMLDDHRDVRVLLAQPLEIEVVVERAEAGGRQLDLADAAEGVALERVVVADVGVLLALVVARALDVLGVGDLDLVGQRVEDLVQDLVHVVDVVGLEVVGRVHQQAEAGMVDLGEHLHRLLDRADDVVDVGLEQEHRAVVIGGLGEVGDDLAALLEALLGLVLGVRHPVELGVVGAGLRDHVARAEVAGVADDLLEVADALLALRLVGVDDVGVAGDAADRQVVVAEGVAHLLGLVLGDLAGGQVDVLEVEVELHRVEAEGLDLLGGLVEAVGKVAGENADLHHGLVPPEAVSDLDFGQLDDAALGDRAVARLDQRDGLDVVGDGERRLGAGRDGMLELLHHALEGVREPHRVPFRRHPLAAGGLLRGIGERRPRAGRPADRALGDAVGALDAPR